MCKEGTGSDNTSTYPKDIGWSNKIIHGKNLEQCWYNAQVQKGCTKIFMTKITTAVILPSKEDILECKSSGS